MLLIRPYLVYQLTGYENKGKNPVKTILLQRLIKKKDEHYEHSENSAVEIQIRKLNFKVPVKPTPFLRLRGLVSASYVSSNIHVNKAQLTLLVKPGKYLLNFLSCFRI